MIKESISRRAMENAFCLDDVFNNTFIESLSEINEITFLYPQYQNYNKNNKNISVNEGKELIIEYLDCFFKKDCRQEFNNFYRRGNFTHSDEPCVYGEQIKKRVYDVFIPEVNSLYNSIAVCHEFFHYLNYKNLSFNFIDCIYAECPSILNEYLFSSFLDKKKITKKNACFEFTFKDRFNCDLNYNICELINNIEYSWVINLGYYISNICATRLVELYKTDEEKFLKMYRALLTRAIRIDDLLAYYNVSICNEKTREATYKLLKKYNEK